LEENIKAVYRQLMRVKPATVKGVYMRNVTISTSMGPGVKIASESME